MKESRITCARTLFLSRLRSEATVPTHRPGRVTAFTAHNDWGTFESFGRRKSMDSLGTGSLTDGGVN